LLVAGPGYGKTSALEEAAAATGARSVWIRCGVGDRDAGRLLRRLVEALRKAAPGTVDVLAERLLLAGGPVDLRVATSDLIDAAVLRLADRVVVVLDDAEHLHDAPQTLALVSDLLGAASGGLHLAVATRRPLSLRLAKPRSAGELSELGPAELTFTPAECAELLRTLGRPSDEPEVRRLFESTEGWPLGTMLSALHGDDPRLRGTGSRSGVFEFLRDELLDTMPAPLRAQALESSVPRELDAGCAEALGLPSDLSDQLAAFGVALRPVDSGGQWRAYHPLVREFLAERLAVEYDPLAVAAAHAKVAPALTRAGRAEEAIEHWLQAERWQEAADLIVETAPGLLYVAPATVRRWVDSLPDDIRAGPGCQLLDGIIEWEVGRNQTAIETLRSSVGGFAAAGDVPGEWLARFALIDPLELMGNWEEAVSLGAGFDNRRALAAGIIPPAVAAYSAAALGALGRMDECAALSARILAHPHAGPLTTAQSIWESDMLIGAGDLDQAVAGAEAAVAEAERADPFNRLFTFAGFLASAVTQQGRDDEAIVLWERVEKLSSSAHMRYMVQLSHAWRALLHARNGRLHEGETHVAQAGTTAGSGWRDAAVETARARIAALQGNAEEVVAAADRALALAQHGLLTERMQTAIELAPALLEAGLLPRAVSVVEEHLIVLDKLAPGKAGCYFRALLLAVRAWLRDAEGRPADAAQDLEQMWDEAGDRNAPDVLRREWRLLEPLLWKALEAGVLDPRAVLLAIANAWPGAEALLPFTAHPRTEVRRAALTMAAGSGHPELIRRLGTLARDPDPELAAAASAAQGRLEVAPPPLAFTVLGDFRVRRGTWWVEDAAWDRRVAQRLVRHLLTVRGGAVSEDVILEAFWPEVAERSARQRLRVAVSCARAALDIPGSPSVIESGEQTLRLKLRDRDTVDAETFARAAETALAEDRSQARSLLEGAARLWTGEPLPQERYSDWAIPWREHLIRKYAEVLAKLARLCNDDGDAPAATDAARRLVELDPLDEEAQRLLMVAYARSGRRAHALRQFLDCRRALVDGAGIEPVRETTELQQRILAGDSV
jgi:ATP/maltotriose-dependent transcriptional regulator MalT/DNA-binding SARP family transcriptional activator